MYPRVTTGDESGITRVIQAYERYLPDYGVELVTDGPCDLKAVHAGSMDCRPDEIVVAHLHGLYWTADYHAPKFEYRTNQKVINSMIHAKEMIVPSAWVNEAIQRDMRRSAHVIPHGIEWEEWEPATSEGYVLWNKNRAQDVCSPRAVSFLAEQCPQRRFISTFALENHPSNVTVTGVVPHAQMKQLLQQCAVYLVTSKETFCIGALEAMACGKPVLYYAYGNVPNLVPHGVVGYGARPGDEADLLAGLHYCLKYAKTLGANGRELVKQYSWATACEQVTQVYCQALEPEAQTVTIVIPCYNKAATVGRAIDSALQQTYPCDVIVVDDGSTDDSWAEIQKRGGLHLRTDNQGVSAARNLGIEKATSDYVACLDADDALDPIFIERLVHDIARDRSLGAVYSKITEVRPDGSTTISPWPGEWNYDQHLAGVNQIPTCCLMRRDMLIALGGYRACYAPGKQCGFEDSDLFLRLGAYGWRAKLATDEPLFLYSNGSGEITSGSKQDIGLLQQAEKDYYRTHYPWYTSARHPFASAATPSALSHPVRQYDEPLVTVEVTGTTHLEKTLISLESQTEHRWEVVAGPLAGYPYIQTQARGAFLVQLQSGDVLAPTFLEQTLRVYADTNCGVVVQDRTACAILRPMNWNGDYCQLQAPLFQGSGVMACPTCQKQVTVSGVRGVPVKAITTSLNDSDYQWVVWQGETGRVVGVTKTVYGSKTRGDRFLCQLTDVAAFGTQVSPDEIVAPTRPIKPPPAPKRMKE
jgi:hypothetical protein